MMKIFSRYLSSCRWPWQMVQPFGFVEKHDGDGHLDYKELLIMVSKQ